MSGTSWEGEEKLLAVCEKTLVAPSTADLERLKAVLDDQGFVIIPSLIPRANAERMTGRLIEIMQKDSQRNKEKLQTLNGTFDLLESQEELDLFVNLVAHPVVLALAEHMVGRDFQISDTGVLWLKANAGYSGFGWHADSPLDWFSKNKKSMVDLCFGMNCLWMLTDFTPQNGATRVLPRSHRSLRHPCGGETGEDGQKRFANEVVAAGPAGSCLIFNHALWHAAGGNFTDQDRIGVSNPYYPQWLDGGNVGWRPIKRSTFERLPSHVRRMHRHVWEDRTQQPGYSA